MCPVKPLKYETNSLSSRIHAKYSMIGLILPSNSGSSVATNFRSCFLEDENKLEDAWISGTVCGIAFYTEVRNHRAGAEPARDRERYKELRILNGLLEKIVRLELTGEGVGSGVAGGELWL